MTSAYIYDSHADKEKVGQCMGSVLHNASAGNTVEWENITGKESHQNC